MTKRNPGPRPSTWRASGASIALLRTSSANGTGVRIGEAEMALADARALDLLLAAGIMRL